MRLLVTFTLLGSALAYGLDQMADQSLRVERRMMSMLTAEQMGLEHQSPRLPGDRPRVNVLQGEASYPSGARQKALWKERTERALRGEPIFPGQP